MCMESVKKIMIIIVHNFKLNTFITKKMFLSDIVQVGGKTQVLSSMIKFKVAALDVTLHVAIE